MLEKEITQMKTKSMLDLQKQQYDRQTLKENIYNMDFFELLKTQHIDATFAVRYVLNQKYDLDNKYKTITPKVVVTHQPHILLKDLIIEKLRYDSDDDSVEDFESVSNR